ncbi:unnamed protein product [Amoebophrya sp. A25]|nr:unnamed protein product [Amoebophrya sp. A25]|eukprot:GSA25T00005943001.1
MASPEGGPSERGMLPQSRNSEVLEYPADALDNLEERGTLSFDDQRQRALPGGSMLERDERNLNRLYIHPYRLRGSVPIEERGQPVSGNYVQSRGTSSGLPLSSNINERVSSATLDASRIIVPQGEQLAALRAKVSPDEDLPMTIARGRADELPVDAMARLEERGTVSPEDDNTHGRGRQHVDAKRIPGASVFERDERAANQLYIHPYRLQSSVPEGAVESGGLIAPELEPEPGIFTPNFLRRLGSRAPPPRNQPERTSNPLPIDALDFLEEQERTGKADEQDTFFLSGSPLRIVTTRSISDSRVRMSGSSEVAVDGPYAPRGASVREPQSSVSSSASLRLGADEEAKMARWPPGAIPADMVQVTPRTAAVRGWSARGAVEHKAQLSSTPRGKPMLPSLGERSRTASGAKEATTRRSVTRSSSSFGEALLGQYFHLAQNRLSGHYPWQEHSNLYNRQQDDVDDEDMLIDEYPTVAGEHNSNEEPIHVNRSVNDFLLPGSRIVAEGDTAEGRSVQSLMQSCGLAPSSGSKKAYETFLSWAMPAVVGILTACTGSLIQVVSSLFFTWRSGLCVDNIWKNASQCCGHEVIVDFRCRPHLATADNPEPYTMGILKTWNEILFDGERQYYAWTIWALSGILLALLAAVLCQRFAPAAAGSGIPEIKAILGGFPMPAVLEPHTLFVKIIGLTTGVSAGLALGKEGPLVHVACCWAAWLARLFPGSAYYGTSAVRRRELLSAAAAAGVSVAFGAPLGGVLFSFEEVSTFFPQRTAARAFIAAVVAALMLMYIDPTGSGKLTLFQVTDDWRIDTIEYVFFAVLGVLGGIVGAIFIAINTKVTKLRRSDWWRDRVTVSLEITLIALFTMLTSTRNRFMQPLMVESIFRLFEPCEDFVNSVGETEFIPRALLSDEMHLCNRDASPSLGADMLHDLFFACILRFAQMCITFGAGLPAGLFVPSLFVGASMGRLFGSMIYCLGQATNGFGGLVLSPIAPSVYGMVGGAAVLGGVCRVTISLVVIMFELTGALKHLVPFMVAIQLAKWTGDLFNDGIYDRHIFLKRYPFLYEPEGKFTPGVAHDIVEAERLACICVTETHTLASLRDLLALVGNGNEFLLSNTHFSAHQPGFPLIIPYSAASTSGPVLTGGAAGKEDVVASMLDRSPKYCPPIVPLSARLTVNPEDTTFVSAAGSSTQENTNAPGRPFRGITSGNATAATSDFVLREVVTDTTGRQQQASTTSGHDYVRLSTCVVPPHQQIDETPLQLQKVGNDDLLPDRNRNTCAPKGDSTRISEDASFMADNHARRSHQDTGISTGGHEPEEVEPSNATTGKQPEAASSSSKDSFKENAPDRDSSVMNRISAGSAVSTDEVAMFRQAYQGIRTQRTSSVLGASVPGRLSFGDHDDKEVVERAVEGEQRRSSRSRERTTNAARDSAAQGTSVPISSEEEEFQFHSIAEEPATSAAEEHGTLSFAVTPRMNPLSLAEGEASRAMMGPTGRAQYSSGGVRSNVPHLTRGSVSNPSGPLSRGLPENTPDSYYRFPWRESIDARGSTSSRHGSRPYPPASGVEDERSFFLLGYIQTSKIRDAVEELEEMGNSPHTRVTFLPPGGVASLSQIPTQARGSTAWQDAFQPTPRGPPVGGSSFYLPAARLFSTVREETAEESMTDDERESRGKQCGFASDLSAPFLSQEQRIEENRSKDRDNTAGADAERETLGGSLATRTTSDALVQQQDEPINLSYLVEKSVLRVAPDTPLHHVHHFFYKLGMRFVAVVDQRGRAHGVITKGHFVAYVIWLNKMARRRLHHRAERVAKNLTPIVSRSQSRETGLLAAPLLPPSPRPPTDQRL